MPAIGIIAAPASAIVFPEEFRTSPQNDPDRGEEERAHARPNLVVISKKVSTSAGRVLPTVAGRICHDNITNRLPEMVSGLLGNFTLQRFAATLL